MGKQVSSGKVRLFQKEVLKYIVLDFENLVFENLVFGDGLQVREVLRLQRIEHCDSIDRNFSPVPRPGFT